MGSEQVNVEFTPRYANVDAVKSEGATFTPPDLAHFVARHMLAAAALPRGSISLLDPACGDGALLLAMLLELPLEARRRCAVIGFDSTTLSHKYPMVAASRFATGNWTTAARMMACGGWRLARPINGWTP